MKSNPKEKTKLGRHSKVFSPHYRILKLEAGSWQNLKAYLMMKRVTLYNHVEQDKLVEKARDIVLVTIYHCQVMHAFLSPRNTTTLTQL